MNLPRMQDLDVKGKRVLLRVDFNVPLDKEGTITDDTRLKEAIPTIQWLLDHGASLILLSHLGRPKKSDSSLSLQVCAKKLEELLKKEVVFGGDVLDQKAALLCKDLMPGHILLMENLRFHKAEEDPQSDPNFAKILSSLGDIYINDAFATAHRAHSSTAIIASFFPKKRGAGLLLQKEIEQLSVLLEKPNRPFFAIIGGAKVSSKLGVLKSLINNVNAFFIGGGMAFTFFKAQGIAIGNSLVEPQLEEEATSFLKATKERKIPVYLPKDLIIADHFDAGAKVKIIDVEQGIPDGWQGLDIGPKTLESWRAELVKAGSVFWNGPVGVFEMAPFAKGTQELAKIIASLHAITIVGGGDSVAAIHQAGLHQKFTHVSTGGGASLEFLEFGKLPGIEALKEPT